eukprot:8465136-Pyramimonas_sp.AAC.1
MVSMQNLLRDNIPIWRPANDIAMTAGRNGRIPSTRIAQLIGILPCYTCQYNCVGQIWVNILYLRDSNQPYSSGNVEDKCEIRNDASSLNDWFIPKTPYKLKCPDPPPVQEVAFSTVLIVDAYHAGPPAGGSDGSWMQAQVADVAGNISSGITPSDTLCANGPWRARVQQLP